MSYLKNFSTTVKAYKTIAEIEKLLTDNGAKGIMKEFAPDGTIKLLYFMIATKNGDISYKLPCDFLRIRETLIKLKKDKKINIPMNKAQSLDHAINVGWRILKDWIYTTISMINIEQTSFEEIFLPYAYNSKSGQTLFEKIKDSNYAMLTDGNND